MVSVGLVVVHWTSAEPARFGPVADRLRQTFGRPERPAALAAAAWAGRPSIDGGRRRAPC
ncbi:MAG: hypothetical protein ACRDTE_31650 [Pseudonocardiaceae bacterium]